MGSSTSTERNVETLWFGDLKATLPNLAGRTVAITGTTSGTGFVLAKTAAEQGARVLLLNRPSARADAAFQALKKGNLNVVAVQCDLQDFASVRTAGAKVVELCGDDGLDVLCCNAGVMGLPDTATKDGFDVQMQTNHLSHFLLTSVAFPALLQGSKKHGEARVVQHSSRARNAPDKPIVAADYYGKNGGNLGGDGFPGLQKWRRYQQSKLANLMFAYSLHDHIQNHAAGVTDPEERKALLNIKSLCAHPGPTDSGLQSKTANAGPTTFIDRWLLKKTIKEAHSVEDGAMGITICSLQKGVKSLDFYGPIVVGKKGPAKLMEPERNTANEELMWAESIKAVGLNDFF